MHGTTNIKYKSCWSMLTHAVNILRPIPIAARSMAWTGAPLHCRDCSFESRREYGHLCFESVVCCVSRGLCDELITCLGESYRMCMCECHWVLSDAAKNIYTYSACIRGPTNTEMKTETVYRVNIYLYLIFVVPCIMLYSGEISPTRCNNCVFYSQWSNSTTIELLFYWQI